MVSQKRCQNMIMKTAGLSRMVKAYVTAYPKEVNNMTDKTINRPTKQKNHPLVKYGPQYIKGSLL